MDSVNMMEARAYALFVGGDPGGASEVLGRVLAYQPEYDWEREMSERARKMRAMIDRGESQAVLQQLEAWRQETLTALSIEPG